MAIIAFTFGSMIGAILALFGFALFGMSLTSAFSLYLTSALTVGGLIIVASLLSPPDRGVAVATTV